MRFPSSEQYLFLANIIVNKLFFRKPHPDHIHRILIIKLDEIGDMATATHVFEMIKLSYPKSHLTVLCKPFVKSLLQYDSFIDELTSDVGHDFSSYQLIVELRGNWQTLKKALFSKVKYRLSRAEVRFKNKGKQLHEVETNSEIVKPILIIKELVLKPKLYFSTKEIEVIDLFLKQNKIEKFVIFHIGARKKLRQWPLDRFALVADFLYKKGLSIVFVGTKDEEIEIQKAMKVMNNPSLCFTSHADLSIFSALCSKASFYIGNESGPIHIAASFDVPLIGLYGPGVKDVFYPYSKNSKVLHHVLKCNPCDQIHCVEPQNPCINRIKVMDVFTNIEQMIK
jgi:ADP-heptose:LPS heptosyltransferase